MKRITKEENEIEYRFLKWKFHGLILIILSMFLINRALAQQLPQLKVSNNYRYLVQNDGSKDGNPFFYLGDTAWELFSRLDKSKVEKYFQVRKNQGFNVIMAISHIELGDKTEPSKGIQYPNREGFAPFLNDSQLFIPEGITKEYWEHVDWVLSKAEEIGLYIALVPYWGNIYVQKERAYKIKEVDMAYNWGYFLGDRYKNRTNIIWVLGGDFAPWNYFTKEFDPDEYQITIATAEGIADGINGDAKKFNQGKADYTTSLMTYHICEGLSSSEYFHNDKFLDFNGIQSGHNEKFIAVNYQIIHKDYIKYPIKPTIDLEPWYEYMMTRKNEQWENPRCSAFDVRRNAYRSVLSGAMGFTYGNNNVWLFYKKNKNYDDRYNPTNDWDSQEGIYSDGAKQMICLKNLFELRPFYQCIPDSGIVSKRFGEEVKEVNIQAARAEDNSFAILYIPTGQVFDVNLKKIDGDINCWWYNPENGKIYNQNGEIMKSPKPFQTINKREKTNDYQFTSPTNHDWVLVLDDSSADLSPMGILNQ